MISKRSKHNVLLPALGDDLHPRQVAEAAIVVSDNGALGSEARAARHLPQQSKNASAAIAVHDKGPAIGGHGQS